MQESFNPIMIKISALFFALLFGANAYAAPFLVCDSVPAGTSTNNQPSSYTISGLPGGTVTSGALANSDGSVQLHYDLGGIANGNYTVTVTATNSAGTSAPSAPFTFALPFVVMPGVPAHLSLAPQ